MNNNFFSNSIKELFPVTPKVRVTDREVVNANGKTYAIYYEGMPYNGKITQNFAYIGLPNSPMPKGGYPAVVAVHGGGGCAFFEWVEYWNGKGYACIAPDMSGRKDGSVPLDCNRAPENKEGGPMGYRPFGTNESNYKDSWLFHGVANIVLSSNILRANDAVNKEKIALTGISWGSVLSMIACGIDNRFAAFAPVYGGGYIYTTPMFLSEGEPPKDLDLWLSALDPVAYLPHIACPTLFSCGTNEPAFLLGNNIRSWALCRTASHSWRQDLAHYHRWRDGEGMLHIYRFFEKVISGTPTPFEIVNEDLADNKITVNLSGALDGLTAKLLSTRADLSTKSMEWEWQSKPVEITNGKIVADITEGATVAFVEITDNKEYAFTLSTKAYTL